MLDPYDDAYFMKQALLEAQKGEAVGEVPVGAVIVAENDVDCCSCKGLGVIVGIPLVLELTSAAAAWRFLLSAGAYCGSGAGACCSTFTGDGVGAS